MGYITVKAYANHDGSDGHTPLVEGYLQIVGLGSEEANIMRGKDTELTSPRVSHAFQDRVHFNENMLEKSFTFNTESIYGTTPEYNRALGAVVDKAMGVLNILSEIFGYKVVTATPFEATWKIGNLSHYYWTLYK